MRSNLYSPKSSLRIPQTKDISTGLPARSFFLGLFLTLFSFGQPTLLTAQESAPLKPVAGTPIPVELREAFLARDLDGGLKILDQLETENSDRLEDWLYYRASLLEQSDRPQEAIDLLNRLEKDFPEGSWIYRARFMKARLLKEIGRFGEAQRIIEQQALRLYSETRRKELAELLIAEGDLLSAKSEPGTVDEKPRNLRKAHTIYLQVAELDPPAVLLEHALYSLVRCSSDQNSSQLINDADRYLKAFDYREMQGREIDADNYHGKSLLTVLLTRAQSLNPIMKRRALEDLLVRMDSEISGHPWRARYFSEFSETPYEEIRQEALLKIVETYREFNSRVAATRRFLEAGEGHPLYWETRFQLGVLLKQNSDIEGSIRHWQKLLEDLPSADGEAEINKLRARTVFETGLASWNLLRLEESLAIFREYVSEFPDAADWTLSQTYCIQIEAQICERFIFEKEYSKARSAIADFSQRYPIHPKTLPLLYQSAMSFAREARHQREESTVEDPLSGTPLFESTLSSLRALNGKYPSTAEGQRALLDIGMVYENDLLNPAEAVKAYRDCFGGAYDGQARERLAELTRVYLAIETERLFRSTDSASFTLDTRNIEKAKVDIFPIDIEAYFRKYQSRKKVEQLDLDLIDPWNTFEIEVTDHEPYRPCTQQVELPVEGQGTWAVVVTAGEFRATTLVVRTDLDIIVQAGRKDVLIYAQNMVEMQPAASTRILIATPGPDNQPVIREAVTGSDGTIRLQYEDLKRDDNVRVLAMFEGNSAVAGLGLRNTLIARGLSPLGHILMDSATYQPGDRVQWSALIRDLDQQNWILPAGKVGRVRISDPEGVEIFRGETNFGDLGTLQGFFDLPISAPMGIWQMEVTSPRGFSTSQSFNVEVPRPLPIQLDFSAKRSVYVRGEQIELVVSAQTWYGKPLAGAPVTILLPYQNEQIEQFLVLDDQGRASFSFDSRTAESSILDFNAILIDEGIQRSLQIPLRQQLWEISLEIPRRGGQFMMGESVPVTILARDLSGKPVSRKIDLRLTEKVRRQNSWNNRNIEEFSVTTDSDGLAQLRIPMKNSGSLTLTAEGVDRWGHPIFAESSLRVYGNTDDSNLIWLVEDVALVTGEKRDLALQCNGTPGPALLTILGDQLVSYRILNLKNGANTISFAASPEIRSAATLRVAKMDRSGLQKADTTFKIRRKLKVSISPPEGAVKPGQEVTLEIQTRNLLDQPVSAEIALAVLDASIDDLYPNWFKELTVSQSDHDPSKIFSMTSSCEFNYRGVTEAIDENLLAEQRRSELKEIEKSVTLGIEMYADAEMDSEYLESMPNQRARKARGNQLGALDKRMYFAEGQSAGRFGNRSGAGSMAVGGGLDDAGLGHLNNGDDHLETRYLAFWGGAITTDNSGKGQVTFRIPERNSTWRIRARGVAAGDLFGEENRQFISSEELVIDSLIPRMALEGDQITPRIRLFNDTGDQTQARISLSWPTADGEARSEKTIALTPGLQEISFDRWPSLGSQPDLPYRIEVVVGEQTYSQSGSVRIQRWGLGVESRIGWKVEEESKRDRLGFEDRSDLLDRRLRLTLGSTIDSGLIDRLIQGNSSSKGMTSITRILPLPDSNDNFTTALRLLAILEALKASTEISASIEEPVAEKLRTLANRFIQKLVTAQKSRGDWSWLPSKKSRRDHYSDAVTSAVLESLSVARKAGFNVPDRVFSRAIPHIEDRFRNTDQGRIDLKSVLLAALTSSGSGDFGAANRLHRNRGKLSSAGLASLIRALVYLDRKAMALEVSQTLLERLQNDQQWSGESNTRAEVALFRNDRILTALSLHALSLAGVPSGKSQSAAHWLRGQLTWQLDRGTALSIAALLRWQGSAVPAQRDCEVIFSINGVDRGRLQVSEGKRYDTILLELGDGPAEFDLATKLAGDSGAFFTAELTGQYSSYPDFKDRDLGIRHAHFLAATPRMSGRELPAGFGILKESRERWKNEVSHLSPGEASRFQLQVTSSNNQTEFVELEIRIPSGLMLDLPSIQGNFTYQDYRQGLLRIWGNLQKNINVGFNVVATSPGKYRMPPVVIRSVAEPQRLTVGNSQEITVLTPDMDSPDEYKPTPDEISSRGQRFWAEGRWREARKLLGPLWEEYSDELRVDPAREIARILMLSAIEAGDKSSMVSFFEILKERNPDLTLSLGNFIRLGEAYRTLGESSRSLEIYSAVNEAIFARDRKVSDLLSESDLLPALNLLQRLTMENAATPAVLAAEQYLADVALNASAGNRKLSADERIQLGLLGRKVLYRFLTLHGEDPTAPDAGLNLVSSLLSSKNWAQARRESEDLAQRYQNPRYLDSFRYTQAVAMWALGEDGNALKLLEEIADSRYPEASGGERPSENRELALFIIGQIHHAANQPKSASKYYEMVKNQFADARDSLRQINARELELDEILEFRPGAPVSIELRYRNIESAEVLAYKVNLMTLALREQDLSRVTEVNLSGISPTLTKTVELGVQGTAGGTLPATKEIEIPLEQEGAYLVIVRGGDVHTSGLILINRMEMVVKNNDGSLRVQIVDPTTGTLIPDVELRVLDPTLPGAAGTTFGITDRRGLFLASVADHFTVIARRGQSDYAFFRMAKSLLLSDWEDQDFGQTTNDSQQLQMEDYFKNVIRFNNDNLGARNQSWRTGVENTQKGIQIKQATD